MNKPRSTFWSRNLLIILWSVLLVLLILNYGRIRQLFSSSAKVWNAENTPQSDANYYHLRGTCFSVLKMKGFTPVSHIPEYSGIQDDRYSSVSAYPMYYTMDNLNSKIDSIYRVNFGAFPTTRREREVDGRMVYEHFYRTGNSRIVLLVVGDSARSWVLKGTKLDIDEDTMYDAITRVVEHAHIRFTGHLTPEDLDFSVDAKPPLTIWRISPEGNLMYTTKRLDSEDWPEHLSITRVPLESDSLSVSDKEKLAKVLADSTSGAANGFRFVVRVKTDSLFTAESDETLAPVDGGGKSRMYRTITIDQLNSYVVEVAAEEQTPASVIDVMRAAAKTFKRHEQYSELIGAAVDDQNRQRFLRARFEAQRAVELYPDSGWSYFERAGAETNLGDFSGGIRDLNKSIALGHKVWNDETLRAICDEQLGNFGATDSDYDAIFAKHDVLSYFEAARFRFSQGRYIDAKAALNAYFSETDEQYGRIWRYFIEWKADGKSSATDHLREYRDGHPIVNTRFSGILIHYLLGEISEDDLFKSAQTVRNQSVVDNLCEANFYAGMNHLLGGSPEKTKEYWDKTIATHVTNFIEYRYAKAHMPR